ncbi:MAG: tetratricopeptide repeat protein [Bacteroidaceae bacterium]|nr:tetratricopeptide repeat protein [Bacteroidaceae bacterium]
MSFDKRKYTYITVAILAMATIYVLYSLIKYGSPTIKSQNEYLVDANKLHNDSLFEEAVEPYMKAAEFENQQSLVNYNTAVNSIMKNYEPLSKSFNDDAYALDSTVVLALNDAMKKLKKAGETESDVADYSSTYHNIGVVNHMRNELEAAAEAYKEALRKNPADEEARYNLAVILYLMKQNQNQQEQNQQNQEQNKEQQQEQQEQEQQDQQNKEQQQQEQQQQEQQQQEQQQQEQQQQNESEAQEEKEKMEQMLKALMQDEKEIREKMEEAQKAKVRDTYIEKIW